MNEAIIRKELQFKAVKSSGAGGQHVNKTASKVELYFDVENSQGLEAEIKNRILKQLQPRLTNENVLILQSGESRSQHKNKKLVVDRLFNVLHSASKKPKLRKKTRPTKASKMKRLKRKKMNSEKKANRKNPLK